MNKRNFFCKLSRFIVIIIVVNEHSTYGQNSDPLVTAPQCPPNYELKNGLCYFIGNTKCPDGYYFYTDGLCYPREQKPCPFENITTTTSSPTTTTTSTTTTLLPTSTAKYPASGVAEQLHCPSGSIFIEKKCRKIICSLGEFHKGHCLYPACPPGLVWRGKSCQEPGYMTTILEIENIVVNQLVEKPIAFERSDTNEVVYHTTTTSTRKPIRSTTTVRTTAARVHKTTSTTTTDSLAVSQNNANGCCTVVAPRICKKYGEKWVCFNRRHKRCDSRICTAPVVYLKAPEIKYEPPVLVMPPNPPIERCSSNSCNTTDVVDCSGCANNLPEHCSSYCYRYMCPKVTCNYMDLDTYCISHPGEFGCSKEDGCLWNWC